VPPISAKGSVPNDVDAAAMMARPAKTASMVKIGPFGFFRLCFCLCLCFLCEPCARSGPSLSSSASPSLSPTPSSSSS